MARHGVCLAGSVRITNTRQIESNPPSARPLLGTSQ
jgi:hypothetical protein